MNYLHLFLLSAIFAAALACGLNFPSDPTSQSSSTTSTPISSKPSTVTATPQQSFSLALTSAGDNLDQLESYRAMLIVDFSGTRAGQPSTGRIEALTEVNQSSSALHYALTVDGAIPHLEDAAGNSELFQVNNQIYITRAGETIWFEGGEQPISPAELGFLQPDRLIVLPSVVSTPPRPDTVNGLATQRYSFSQADLSSPNLIFNQAQGELWLATPGNYLVQYVISASLQMVAPLPEAHILDEGTLNLHYTLTNLTTDFTILPPGNAVKMDSGALAALPRLADAELTSVFPNLIEYTSSTGAISATLFYRDQLLALDWQEENSTIFTEKAKLTFSKAGQTLTIIITPSGEGDKIKVLLELKSQ